MTTPQIVCVGCGQPHESSAIEPLCAACRALFMCGPSEHFYCVEGTAVPDRGWTAFCIKCGARAIDEAMWT